MTLDVGSELAGYRIESIVGRGGMGTVYGGEHLVLGRKAALKVLLPELAGDEDFRARFIRESQHVAAIEHPNIIPIYDAGEDGGVAYIAMRFVRGQDLADLVASAGIVDPLRLLAILGETAAALDAAHAHDLVHRDVKPANVLVDEDSDRAYLTDFGIAKRGRSPGQTAVGLFMGTVDYAAPEQIEGKEVGPATDLYALGCVLFEGLTGRKPFEKETDVAVVYAHLLDPPPSATELRAELPAAIDAVIAKAMAKAPEERFASCRELVEAARDALGGTFVPQAVADSRPSARARSTFPVPPTPLLGREREVEEVLALLKDAQTRLLTITGAGGTGKTRLAVEVATRIGGGVFVDLAPVRDPDVVGPTIASVLGVEDASQPAVESIRARIGGDELLLVLDNFEQVVGAAPLVSELLDAVPGLKLLVTSQSPLRLRSEHQYALDPLDTADAVALFVERAQAVKPTFAMNDENEAAVTEIVRRLDALPLALELAASRVKLMSPQAIATRLEQRLDLLTGGPQDLPDRQQTLRNAIDWSYGLLEEPERRVFARLGVFRGGCSLEAAEAVCGAPDGLGLRGLVDVLASLVDKSLVRQVDGVDGEPRFVLLETIREYASARLEESAEASSVRRAHAERYLALVEMAEPELTGAAQATWLERLDEEHGNLRVALDCGDLAIALRLAGGLVRFWSTRGHMQEGRRWLDRALDEAAGVDPRVLTKAYFAAGYAAVGLGDYDEAGERFERSLALARDLGEADQLEGAALAQLAWLAMARGQENAQELAAAGLERARAAGDKLTASGALNVLAELAMSGGDEAEARQLFEESLSLRRGLGDTRLVANSLLNLGRAELAGGNAHRAGELFEQGLALAQEVGDTWSASVALVGRGQKALADREHELARETFEEAMTLARRRGDKRLLAECLQGLALAKDVHGWDPARAARMLGASAALFADVGIEPSRAEQALVAGLRLTLQNALGEDQLAAEEAAGRALPLEQAIVPGDP